MGRCSSFSRLIPVMLLLYDEMKEILKRFPIVFRSGMAFIVFIYHTVTDLGQELRLVPKT